MNAKIRISVSSFAAVVTHFSLDMNHYPRLLVERHYPQLTMQCCRNTEAGIIFQSPLETDKDGFF